jgi:Raf kinase inhibitor-like YbhB/YbcL family protein
VLLGFAQIIALEILPNLRRTVAVSAAFLLPLAVGQTKNIETKAGTPQEGGTQSMAFAVTSPSFQNGVSIPKKFTCDGADVSPELQWTAPPTGTQSLALIVHDQDAPAGTWTHWVLFDLPPESKALPEGVAKVDRPPTGGRQGRNDFRRIGYGGPCPPAGKPHRYFFRVYALAARLSLEPGTGRQELEQAMQGHILATAELMGTYRR